MRKTIQLAVIRRKEATSGTSTRMVCDAPPNHRNQAEGKGIDRRGDAHDLTLGILRRQVGEQI